MAWIARRPAMRNMSKDDRGDTGNELEAQDREYAEYETNHGKRLPLASRSRGTDSRVVYWR